MISKQHQTKYKEFIKACRHELDYVIIASLDTSGDNVEEIKQNFELLREHNKKLAIAENDMILSFGRGL